MTLAAALSARGEPFVLATVVRREAPSSAHTGDAALISRDGRFYGWLGGSCTRPLVVREALEALADEQPRLVNLSRDPQAQRRPGMSVLEMTCHSGGMVEVFIEPVLPRPHLVVYGASPTARALVRLGRAMGYHVQVVDPEADADAFAEADHVSTALEGGAVAPAGAYAVVATIGEWDTDAIVAAVQLKPAYLGVVASRRRFAHVRQALEGRGLSREALDCIRSPAGLDIGARSPEEIALSIMAEIVEMRRVGPRGTVGGERAALGGGDGGATKEARDPVCGMRVTTADARFTAEVGGATYYFCGGGCRDRFVADPAKYASLAAGAEDA